MPDEKDEVKVEETSAVATCELGFKDVTVGEGEAAKVVKMLHQRFIVTRSDGSSTPEWRPVPTLEA